MESNENFKGSYSWVWKANPDPFDSSQEPIWTPYDIAVSSFMEENHLKGIKKIEVDVGEDTYIMDLQNGLQKLKIDTFRQRPIKRVLPNEDIRVLRKNRFTQNITDSSYKNNNLSSHHKTENLQKKIRVNELLALEDKNKDSNWLMNAVYKIFNFSKVNYLLDQEVCVSSKICEEVKAEFSKAKPKFENSGEIEAYIFEEITKQAHRFLKLDKDGNVINTLENIKSSTYIKHAEIYIKKLTELKMPIEEKLIHLYTLEGFLVYTVNDILRRGSMLDSSMHLYFVLLQASIAIASKKFNPLISHQALYTIDRQQYYKLFRGAKISEKILLEDSKNLEQSGSGKFLVYHEFLSTSRDENVAKLFLHSSNPIEGEVRVFYSFLIPKKEAENNNLMCFIETISAIKSEFEVLLCCSTIFQIENIEKKSYKAAGLHYHYYDITLLFVSNGFNKFDFLKYFTHPWLYLKDNHIGNEDVKFIAEYLKANTNLTDLILSNNKIGNTGASYIAEFLGVNSTLTVIDLSNNQISDKGTKFISQSLHANQTLESIDLSYNNIGDDGAKSISESLKTNSTLKRIDLACNQIRDKGAILIAESLIHNKTIISIELIGNGIESKLQNILEKDGIIKFTL